MPTEEHVRAATVPRLFEIQRRRRSLFDVEKVRLQVDARSAPVPGIAVVGKERKLELYISAASVE